ncbi:hypothetical protein HQQ94_20800 [Shewanella sp. VB17]|uniref:hypothetical protein n=1 Tax=Shewanella sp. VB17 TaxID=2739432 RepID=UPI001565C54A|nr:hypothetical protein [Shewanella sp. VB17]NRD75614.1 hypothetical protein [Shewanella sp. VB17]
MNIILRPILLLIILVCPLIVSANNDGSHDLSSSAEDILAEYDSVNEQQSAEQQIEKVKHKLDDEAREMLNSNLSEHDAK